MKKGKSVWTKIAFGLCLAFLLISAAGLFFPSGAQAAIWNLESVPIKIYYNQTGSSSSWDIKNFAGSDDYNFGYNSTVLLTGTESRTVTFDNGVYDFWLDTDGDEIGNLFLLNGDATLDFYGPWFTDNGITYYASFSIDWAADGDYDFVFSTTTDPNAGAAPVPSPTTLLLLGSGLIGLIVLGRRRLSNRA